MKKASTLFCESIQMFLLLFRYFYNRPDPYFLRWNNPTPLALKSPCVKQFSGHSSSLTLDCQQPRLVSIFLPLPPLFQCVTSYLLITCVSMTLQRWSPPPGLSYPKCLPDTISHIISQNSACLEVNSFFSPKLMPPPPLPSFLPHLPFSLLLFFCISHLETRTITHLAAYQVPEGFPVFFLSLTLFMK